MILSFLDFYCRREDVAKNKEKQQKKSIFDENRVVWMSYDAARTPRTCNVFSAAFERCYCIQTAKIVSCAHTEKISKKWSRTYTNVCFSLGPTSAHNLSQYYLSLRPAHDKCCPTITVALNRSTVDFVLFFSRFVFGAPYETTNRVKCEKIQKMKLRRAREHNDNDAQSDLLAAHTQERKNETESHTCTITTDESSSWTGTHKCVQRALERINRFDCFLFMHVYTSSALGLVKIGTQSSTYRKHTCSFWRGVTMHVWERAESVCVCVCAHHTQAITTHVCKPVDVESPPMRADARSAA